MAKKTITKKTVAPSEEALTVDNSALLLYTQPEHPLTGGIRTSSYAVVNLVETGMNQFLNPESHGKPGVNMINFLKGLGILVPVVHKLNS